MSRIAILSVLVAAVLFVVTGGHWYAGILMAIGLTSMLGLVEPLVVR